MHGLAEIRRMNRAATDLPQTKREADYRVQRDRLGQVMRKLLGPKPTCVGTAHLRVRDYAAEADARKVLGEIFGE